MQGLLIRIIVIKKVVVASLLVILSLAAIWSSADTVRLAQLAEEFVEADRRLLAALARRALDLGPEALRGLAAVVGTYAFLVYVAAWATWTGRGWGDWLLVVLLVLPLPYEVLECLQDMSLSSITLLGLNLVALVVLLRRALKQQHSVERGN